MRGNLKVENNKKNDAKLTQINQIVKRKKEKLKEKQKMRFKNNSKKSKFSKGKEKMIKNSIPSRSRLLPIHRKIKKFKRN